MQSPGIRNQRKDSRPKDFYPAGLRTFKGFLTRSIAFLVPTREELIKAGVYLDERRDRLLSHGEEFNVKRCDEIMTKDPICCLPNDIVSTTAELMKSENIGAIPVIENMKTKRLVGIITDRDLTLQIVANGHEAKSTKIADVMTRKVITCYVDDDVQKAVDAMAEHQLHRIPVVDKDHKIAGIISLADLATRAGQKKKLAKVVKRISLPAG